MRIDLHSHSSASDGTDAPADVVRQAGAAGLDVLALTDHDTISGHAAAAAALPAGLRLVGGMELSCRARGRSVHMLAYGFDPADPELSAECARLRDGRLDRARAMVEALRGLGVPVTWEQVRSIARGDAVGRPHIARAMVDSGVIAAPEEAFTPEWIGPGGRAHVGRYALDPVWAVGLVRAAGGACVLAHPHAERGAGRIEDEEIAALADAGLAGVEVDHPGHDATARRHLRGLAGELGLAVTGSSDDHGELTGHRLGCETTDPAAFDALMATVAHATWR